MCFRVYIPLGIFFLLVLSPPPAPAVVADRILAIVNHEVISFSDVEKYREAFLETRVADDPAALNELIDQKLLLAEAKKLEILPPSEEEITRAYKNLRLRFGKPETFELMKIRLILTEDEIKENIKQLLLIDKLIEQRIQFFVFVAPGEIEAYYQEHSGEFMNQSPEAARKTIQEIRMAEKFKQKRLDYLVRLRAKAAIRINRPLPG